MMSLSKNQQKLIKSLHQKKYRILHQQFVAEGEKVVNELLNSNYNLVQLFYTKDFENSNAFDGQLITDDELKKVSSLKTPNKVLAIFNIPKQILNVSGGLILALDDVNDPGNLGTIIRLCDWFGIENLVCSNNTVDCYNPKVVQASMGSITRVTIVYNDLIDFLKNTKLPIYSAVMDGKNIYESKLPKNAILVMGNESNGICDAILELESNKISIPRFGKNQKTESLNVATATSILLSEYSRSS